MVDQARARRLAKRITHIVAEALEHEVKDPRLTMVTITDTRVTGDLREATVYYTVLGETVDAEPDTAGAAAALASATGVLRSKVGAGTGIRHTPSLSFVADVVPDEARRMEELLARTRESDAEVARRAVGAQPAGDSDPTGHRASPSDAGGATTERRRFPFHPCVAAPTATLRPARRTSRGAYWSSTPYRRPPTCWPKPPTSRCWPTSSPTPTRSAARSRWASPCTAAAPRCGWRSRPPDRGARHPASPRRARASCVPAGAGRRRGPRLRRDVRRRRARPARPAGCRLDAAGVSIMIDHHVPTPASATSGSSIREARPPSCSPPGAGRRWARPSTSTSPAASTPGSSPTPAASATRARPPTGWPRSWSSPARTRTASSPHHGHPPVPWLAVLAERSGTPSSIRRGRRARPGAHRHPGGPRGAVPAGGGRRRRRHPADRGRGRGGGRVQAGRRRPGGRSRCGRSGRVDVAAAAKALGGGGHPTAAGVTLEGTAGEAVAALRAVL